MIISNDNHIAGFKNPNILADFQPFDIETNIIIINDNSFTKIIKKMKIFVFAAVLLAYSVTGFAQSGKPIIFMIQDARNFLEAVPKSLLFEQAANIEFLNRDSSSYRLTMTDNLIITRGTDGVMTCRVPDDTIPDIVAVHRILFIKMMVVANGFINPMTRQIMEKLQEIAISDTLPVGWAPVVVEQMIGCYHGYLTNQSTRINWRCPGNGETIFEVVCTSERLGFSFSGQFWTKKQMGALLMVYPRYGTTTSSQYNTDFIGWNKSDGEMINLIGRLWQMLHKT